MLQIDQEAAVTTSSLPTIEELYTTYSIPLHRYLRRFSENHEQAEDLMQEVFCRAWKAWPHLQTVQQVRGWLYRIATNVAYDHLRRQRLMSWCSYDVLVEERLFTDDLASEEDMEERICTVILLSSALGQLPPNYRQALLLDAQSLYSREEIANIIGVAPSGMKMYISRARRHLRALLTQTEDDNREKE